MQNSTEKTRTWAEELDALIAAPQHHMLLLENEVVREIDTSIPPGESTALHTHKWPASLYILSWSDFIRCDHEGNIALDSRDLVKSPSPATALWSEPLAPHTLKNIGNKDLHIISIEIKI